MIKKYSRLLLPFLILTFISVWISFPLLRHPTSTLVDDDDGALIAWIMTWSAKSLMHHPTQLFNAPIFYPLPLTYTFSDPLLSGMLIGLPAWVLTGEPVVFSTVNYCIAIWLTSIFSYLLLKELTKNRWSALAGAVLISFSSLHFAYYIHLHTFMIQGIPLGLWAWIRFSQTQKKRWLILWALAFLFQALNSPLSGYLFLGTHGMYAFDNKSWQAIRIRWKVLALVAICCSILLVTFYLPYLQAANVYSSQRTLRDAAHFALSLNTWWLNGGVTQLAFLGGIVLALVKIVNNPNRRSFFQQPLYRGICLTLIVSFILSLGPVLKWSGETVKVPFAIPLPYAAAYYLVPGIDAFRTPERWFLVAGLMLIILITLLWRKKPAVLILFAALTLLLEQPWSIQTHYFANRAERPAMYNWLDANQIKTALFIPTYVYDDKPTGAKQETHRMLWLIGNQHITKLVNGYSGYAPQQTLNSIKRYNQLFPHPQFWQLVQAEKIDAVVIELDQLSQEQRALLESLSISAAYRDTHFVVYQHLPLAF